MFCLQDGGEILVGGWMSTGEGAKILVGRRLSRGGGKFLANFRLSTGGVVSVTLISKKMDTLFAQDKRL